MAVTLANVAIFSVESYFICHRTKLRTKCYCNHSKTIYVVRWNKFFGETSTSIDLSRPYFIAFGFINATGLRDRLLKQWSWGVALGHLVYFVVIWYISWLFDIYFPIMYGILCQQKSGSTGWFPNLDFYGHVQVEWLKTDSSTVDQSNTLTMAQRKHSSLWCGATAYVRKSNLALLNCRRPSQA
jgi:hypothetical protein